MTKPVSTAYVLSFRGRLWEDADHEYYSLLCDLVFEGTTEGAIKGSLSVYHSKDVNIVLRGDLRLLPPSRWINEGGKIAISLHVFIEAVEGAEALNHVTVRAEGIYANRKCTGHYDIYKLGKIVEQPPWPSKEFRTFTLQEANPMFCARCWTEVTSDDPQVCHTCYLHSYCSKDCYEKDKEVHADVCAIAAAGPNSFSRIVVTYQHTRFNVYFKTSQGKHTILVGPTNPKTCNQYTLTFDIFDDNRREEQRETTSEQHAQNVVIFEKVALCAITGQKTSLAASSLHWLHAHCHEMDTLERLYAMYYEYILCLGNDGDGTKVISVVEDYLYLARPLYEYATVLLEGALKSRLPSEFWARIDIAKNIAIQLFNYNSSAKIPEEDGYDVVCHQQRHVLHLLARIFISMATRLPRPQSDDVLRRAAECYIDTIEDQQFHGSVLDLARTRLRLSCVYLMRDTDEYRKKAIEERQAAFKILERHYQTAPQSQPQQINKI
eukprot:PhF_6_TR9200/c0_g1_i1/m.14403